MLPSPEQDTPKNPEPLGRQNSWSRLVHCSTLLGYSLILSCCFGVPALAWLGGQVRMTSLTEVDQDLGVRMIMFAMSISAVVHTPALVAQSLDSHRGGPKNARDRRRARCPEPCPGNLRVETRRG